MIRPRIPQGGALGVLDVLQAYQGLDPETRALIGSTSRSAYQYMRRNFRSGHSRSRFETNIQPRALESQFNQALIEDTPMKDIEPFSRASASGQVSRTKSRSGRKRKINLYREIMNRMSSVHAQWHGMGDFNSGFGTYQLSMGRGAGKAAGRDYVYTALLHYAFNLSGLANGAAGINGGVNTSCYTIPFYQQFHVQLKNATSSGSVYLWLPVPGKCNHPLGTNLPTKPTVETGFNYPWILENYTTNVPKQSSYVHEWSDIQMVFYGTSTRPCTVSASIVNFLRPEVAPVRTYTQKADLVFGDIFNTSDTATGASSYWATTDALVSDVGYQYQLPHNTVFRGMTSEDGDAVNSEMSESTVFWDAYWSHHSGHPFTSNHIHGSKKKWMRTKKVLYAKTILPGLSIDEDNLPRQCIVKHFMRSGKYFNTCQSMPEMTNMDTIAFPKSYTPAIVVGTPAPVTVNTLSNGFNTTINVDNIGLYGTNRKHDDWLVIKGDYMYNDVPNIDNTIPAFNAGTSNGNGIPQPGFLSVSNTAVASFDLMVRSKWNTRQ